MAAFAPCVGVTFVAAAISATILDVWSYSRVEYLLVPNFFWVVAVVVMMPLVCLLSVEANVIISSRVNDIRAAQQLGGLVVLPIVALVLLIVTGLELSALIAALVIVVLVIADIALFFLSKETFQREEILTKWK